MNAPPRVRAEYLPRVTIETDGDAVELAVAFGAHGEPCYSDVPEWGPWSPTENEAEQYGARLVSVGNWRSFTVEKRYFAAPVLSRPAAPDQHTGAQE